MPPYGKSWIRHCDRYAWCVRVSVFTHNRKVSMTMLKGILLTASVCDTGMHAGKHARTLSASSRWTGLVLTLSGWTIFDWHASPFTFLHWGSRRWVITLSWRRSQYHTTHRTLKTCSLKCKTCTMFLHTCIAWGFLSFIKCFHFLLYF